MNLVDFNKRFPDEASCIAYFKSKREADGLKCPNCGCVHLKWKSYRSQWECKECGHRIGLRAGTVMHSSKLPLSVWFTAIHLMTATKKSFSAKEMQRQLGISCYQTVWEMMHKLRDVMGKRDANYKLKGSIELNDAFFTISVESSDENLKRGRGSQRKSKVLVIAESVQTDNDKRSISKAVGHIKMFVLDDLKAPTLDAQVVKWINSKADIVTDDSKSYVNFKNLVNSHMSQVIEPKNISKVLPWVHVAIGNAKRLLLDVHHDIQADFLQSYLNEFCFKFNRRKLDMFDRLMNTCTAYRTAFMHRVYKKSA